MHEKVQHILAYNLQNKKTNSFVYEYISKLYLTTLEAIKDSDTLMADPAVKRNCESQDPPLDKSGLVQRLVDFGAASVHAALGKAPKEERKEVHSFLMKMATQAYSLFKGVDSAGFAELVNRSVRRSKKIEFDAANRRGGLLAFEFLLSRHKWDLENDPVFDDVLKGLSSLFMVSHHDVRNMRYLAVFKAYSKPFISLGDNSWLGEEMHDAFARDLVDTFNDFLEHNQEQLTNENICSRFDEFLDQTLLHG